MFLSSAFQAVVYGDTYPVIRYSEFDDLRQRLESSFPHAKSALPALPPKSVLCMRYQSLHSVLPANMDYAQTNSGPSSSKTGASAYNIS